MIDVTHQISAVSRTVGERRRKDGETVHLLTIGQTYDSDIEDVWNAVTDPQRLSRWFLPVSGELREGGRYQLEGNAGGTIERCDPPKGFAATWEYGGGISWIAVDLTADPQGGTRFELRHTVPDDEHWEQYGAGAKGVGWDLAVRGMSLHLSSGAAAVPTEAVAWMSSEEGTRFITVSSDSWRDAAIAGGADATSARAQAERTRVASTGGA